MAENSSNGLKDDGRIRSEFRTGCVGSKFTLVTVSLASLALGVLLSKYQPSISLRPRGQLERTHVSTKVVSEVDLDATTVQILGQKGALLFNSLDVDENKKLTAAEFGPVVEKLVGEAPPVLVKQRSDGNQGLPIVLTTNYQQFVFESTKTYEDEGAEGLMRNFKSYEGLRSWVNPQRLEATYFSTDFRPFLPKTGDEIVGRAYSIYKTHLEPWHHANSGKYYPPTPSSPSEVILYRLASMFHKNVFLLTRFAPHGAVAVVQAANADFYNIRFRMHVEYQLNDPPLLPFWYTPAQFTGNLIISRDGLSVRHVSLYLPNHRKLNIDMEWITQLADQETGEGEHMEVEIGYQPLLNLTSGNPPDLEWTEEIGQAEADSLLEKTFYPFKEVKYEPLGEAFDKAAAEDKLVHSILLWGSLDDQSC